MIRLGAAAALLAALLSCGGCQSPAACRPNTLFIKLTLDGLPGGVDTLRAEVVIDGNKLSADVPYKTGSGLELQFADGQYPAGKAIDVTIAALMGGVTVASLKQSGFVVPASCGALSFSFAVDMSGAIADMSLPLNQLDGAPCNDNSQCQSGFCVDNVCCDSGCDGQCEACDVPATKGMCVGLDNETPHGTRAKCGGVGTTCGGLCKAPVRSQCSYPGNATSCRDKSCAAGVKTLSAGCDGNGGCPPVATFTCPAGTCGAAAMSNDCTGACNSDPDCNATAATPYCNQPQGVCLATRTNGAACTLDNQCTSLHCTDGVCCDNACNGQCQVCNRAGNVGACATVTSGQPVSNAVTTRPPCTGTGACKGSCDGASATACDLPAGNVPCGPASCASGVRAPAPVCDGAGGCPATSGVACTSNQCQDTQSCLPRCNNDPDCGANRYCNLGVCFDKKPNGGSCGGDNQCQNGHCVGGICCATTCAGTQPACKADGSVCVCTASPDSCTANMGAQYSCNASGGCSCSSGCIGKICGGDGCGGDCGTCPAETPTCNGAGTACDCVASPDSCTQALGAQFVCSGGSCQCTPDCSGKVCGGDGCGGSCGACGGTTPDCNAAGTACVCSASPDSCASMGPQEVCNTTTGACVCQKSCAQCGDADGCGGTCGCGTGKTCCMGINGSNVCMPTTAYCCSDTTDTWSCPRTSCGCDAAGTCVAHCGTMCCF